SMTSDGSRREIFAMRSIRSSVSLEMLNCITTSLDQYRRARVLDISVAFALDRLRGCTASDHLIKQLADKPMCITNIVVLAGARRALAGEPFFTPRGGAATKPAPGIRRV